MQRTLAVFAGLVTAASSTGADPGMTEHSSTTGELAAWQHGVEGAMQRAHAWLGAMAERVNGEDGILGDLAVLTTEPVANSESSGFGWRNDPIRHRPRFHSGTDFRGRRGTPVLAAGDGIVVFAGRKGGYGNLIELDHGGGLITRYAHLRRIAIDEHTIVTGGQQIGEIGSTGRATGPHLHFEVRVDGRPIDPVTALTVAELARTSPATAQIAAFALAPEVQAQLSSAIDPPKTKADKKADKSKHESRPERRGRAKRVVPVS